MTTLTLWAPGRATVISPLPEPLKESTQAEPPKASDLTKELWPSSLSNLDVTEIHSQEAWAQVFHEIEQAGICGLDLETTGLDPLSSRARLAQLSLPGGKVYVADLWELAYCSPLHDLGKLSERSDIKKVGHNLKFDLEFIQASQSRRLKIANIFDTMLASQVAWAGMYCLKPAPKATKNPWKKRVPDHNLKSLAKRHLGLTLHKELQASDWSGDLSPEQKTYAAMDAAILLPLHKILLELLRKNDLEHIAELEFRALPAVIELELQGLPLDTQACRTMMEQRKTQAQEVLQKLQAEAQAKGFTPRLKKGKKYSPLLDLNSYQDLLAYLQDQGYNIDSTKEATIKELALNGSLFAQDFLQYRRLSKQVKFLEDWLLKLSPIDGRLHPGYFQIQAATGRFSSREPNAQQIPKKGEDGLAMRKLFRAPQGKKLIKADFAGIELRTMACLSQDKTMLEAFQAGQDLHKLTASRISGLPMDQITKTQRQGAKAVNFLLIYGGKPELLQRRAKETYGVDMTLEQAQEAHKMFFQTYPGVEAFHQKQQALKGCPRSFFFHYAESGFQSLPLVCSQTVLRRKRVWGWLQGKTLASINQLYNTPSQGTGADLLKVVMAEVYASLPEEVKIVGCVHDEVVLEAPEAQAQKIAANLLDIMRRVGSEMLSPIPVDAEIEVLDTWGGNLEVSA